MPATELLFFFFFLLLPSSGIRLSVSDCTLHSLFCFVCLFCFVFKSIKVVTLLLSAVSAQVLCTLFSVHCSLFYVHHTTMDTLQCHFIRRHIRRMHVCLGVTCHLHLWQNERDLLRATAITQQWNGYRNESQRIKLNLEKKILPPLQPGREPATLRSRVWRSTAELSPL